MKIGRPLGLVSLTHVVAEAMLPDQSSVINKTANATLDSMSISG
jgi:hypothetical protein